MKKLTKKRLNTLISTLYGKYADGKSINILDIGKVFRAGEQAYAESGTVEAVDVAIKLAVEKYCEVIGGPANPTKEAA